RSPHNLLPAPGKYTWFLEAGARPFGFASAFRTLLVELPKALSVGRLALVLGHSRAGHWNCSSRSSSYGGSLRLHHFDRFSCDSGVVDRRLYSRPQNQGRLSRRVSGPCADFLRGSHLASDDLLERELHSLSARA